MKRFSLIIFLLFSSFSAHAHHVETAIDRVRHWERSGTTDIQSWILDRMVKNRAGD